jgi:hypothetical protein
MLQARFVVKTTAFVSLSAEPWLGSLVAGRGIGRGLGNPDHYVQFR